MSSSVCADFYVGTYTLNWYLYLELCYTIFQSQLSLQNHKKGPVRYTLTTGAQEAYAGFYNEISERARGARDRYEDDVRGALMKAQVVHQ